MYISANMLSGLNSLLNVNSELNRYQTQATTGKRVNQASDGLAAFLTAQGFDNRSTRLQMMNDGLTSVLSSVKAAKAGLEQIQKNLNDLRSTLKSASETQQLQGAQGSQQLADSDPNNVQFSFSLAARTGKTAQGTLNTPALTNDTLLYQAADSGSSPTETQSQVYLGGQAMRDGMTIRFSNGNSDWTIKIGRTDATGVIAAAADDAANRSTTVYTVGQLLATMRDKVGIDTSMSVNFSNATVQATFTGAQFRADSNGNPLLGSPLGVAITVDYAALGAARDGFRSRETIDLNGNMGYFNVNAMFNATRASNNSRVDYIEDQKTTFTGADARLFAAPVNRVTIEKTADNAVYSTNQTAKFLGVQHNYQAAVEAKAADPARANAARAFRQAAVNINNLVSDATSQSINLLYGVTLNATLNETGKSQAIQITTVGGTPMSFTANGLGIVDAGGNAVDTFRNFAVNGDGTPGLTTAISKVDAALLRTQSGLAQVAIYQSMLQDRKDFNTSIVKLLNQSSLDLVGADATEVAAKTSSLQIQQSFGQSILASTKQAEQSLLQLLR